MTIARQSLADLQLSKDGCKLRARTALQRALRLQPNISEADGAKRAMAAR
jgi:hypothetical protein